MPPRVVSSATFCRLEVKAIPGASCDEVAGTFGSAVKIKLRAPPVEGRANGALLEFLAEKLDLPRRALALERGDTSRHKLVRIDGLDSATVRSRLGV